jgi:hypothetical protein
MGFTQIANFKPEQHYIIYAFHSNCLKAIDISQAENTLGQAIIYSYHGAPNQRFVFEAEGNMYRIRNVKENKYLNVTNDGPNEGMWVRVDEKGKHKSQLWSVVPATEQVYTGKQAYHIQSIFGKTLETPKGKLDNETQLQQGLFNATDGQTWVIK